METDDLSNLCLTQDCYKIRRYELVSSHRLSA
jgi:hypothetical protein